MNKPDLNKVKDLVLKLVRRPLNRWLWLKVSQLIEAKLLALMGVELLMGRVKGDDAWVYVIRLRDAWLAGLVFRF